MLCVMSVRVVEPGVEMLSRRFDVQNVEAVQQAEFVKEITTTLETLDQAAVRMGKKYEEFKLKQTQLYVKLLYIMRKIEVLRCRGVPLDVNELK